MNGLGMIESVGLSQVAKGKVCLLGLFGVFLRTLARADTVLHFYTRWSTIVVTPQCTRRAISYIFRVRGLASSAMIVSPPLLFSRTGFEVSALAGASSRSQTKGGTNSFYSEK